MGQQVLGQCSGGFTNQPHTLGDGVQQRVVRDEQSYPVHRPDHPQRGGQGVLGTWIHHHRHSDVGGPADHHPDRGQFHAVQRDETSQGRTELVPHERTVQHVIRERAPRADQLGGEPVQRTSLGDQIASRGESGVDFHQIRRRTHGRIAPNPYRLSACFPDNLSS